MQRWARAGRDPRTLAALAVLLVAGILAACTVAITPGASPTPAHQHAARGTAVLLASSSDTALGGARGHSDGVAAVAPAIVRLAARAAATSDASTAVSSRTAQSPQVRGPPGQALA